MPLPFKPRDGINSVTSLAMKRIFSPSLSLVTAIILLCMPCVGAKPHIHQIATGVLYYMEGGTGSGSINIRTRNRTLEIDYWNPRKEYGFKDEKGYQLGAIWKVSYHEEKLDSEEAKDEGRKTHLVLDSARFTGRFDQSVKSGNEFIYQHYGSLAKGDYQSAYNDLSPSLRLRQSYESFVAGFRDVKFLKMYPVMVGPNTFLQYAVPDNATEIVSNSAQKVVIDVEMNKLVKGDYTYYRFDLIRVGDKWQIDKVKKLDKK